MKEFDDMISLIVAHANGDIRVGDAVKIKGEVRKLVGDVNSDIEGNWTIKLGPVISTRVVTEDEFLEAMRAVRGELNYQDGLERRTEDEAKDPAGFFTLARRYLRKGEDEWADNPGPELALHALRKIAAIAIRGMIYCGVRHRPGYEL